MKFYTNILKCTISVLIMLGILPTDEYFPGILALATFGQADHAVGYVCIVLGHLQVTNLHLQLKQAEVTGPGHAGAEAKLLHQGHHLLTNTKTNEFIYAFS